MRSDERVRLALDAVAGPARTFRATLEATIDDVRAYLATCQSSWEARVDLAAAQLGPLAAGRVDAGRFAALFLAGGATDGDAVRTIEQALDTLRELAARGDDLLYVAVPPGGSLYAAVADTLAAVGRGFAAARAVSTLRAAGGPPAVTPDLGPLPFSRWTGAERRLTPPLVVDVRGGDLRPTALAEFMDGRQRIVLVVEGECSPAPLVRLIGPGTFVLQTGDGAGLERLVAGPGPGIAAVVPDSAARFVHDPAAGAASWARLTIESLPERPPRRPVAGLSALQQQEELDLLKSLAARPATATAPPPAAAAGPASADPADRLASWLLSQVDLSDVR